MILECFLDTSSRYIIDTSYLLLQETSRKQLRYINKKLPRSIFEVSIGCINEASRKYPPDVSMKHLGSKPMKYL
jgi:hypothetical protein